MLHLKKKIFLIIFLLILFNNISYSGVKEVFFTPIEKDILDKLNSEFNIFLKKYPDSNFIVYLSIDENGNSWSGNHYNREITDKDHEKIYKQC